MPGHDHGPSIKNPKVYEALRQQRGMSKSQAAAISNAQAGRGTATARSVARGTARVARSGGRRRR